MSSILDALRKLEEEKAQQFSTPETPLPIEPPVREPAPRRTRSRRSKRSAQDHSRKLWLAVPAVIFALGIIWAATVMGPKSDLTYGERDLLAAATPAPVENHDRSGVAELRDPTLERIEAGLREVAETPGLAPPVAPEPTPIQPAELDPEPAPREPVPQTNEVVEPTPTPDAVPANVAPIRVDVKPVPTEVVEEPEELVIDEPPIVAEPEPIEQELVPAEPFEPEPEPVVEDVAPPRTEPSERYRNAMAVSNALRGETAEPEEPEPVEQDIRRYDIMTRTVRARLGIPELVINMLGLPNERQPRPSALINYNNVYVGETIPDTHGRVHLIGVDIRGIAVEVEGERFYYPK